MVEQDFDASEDGEKTRIVQRPEASSSPPDEDDEATRLISRKNASSTGKEEDRTVVISRSQVDDDQTRLSSHRAGRAESIDEQTALAPNRVRRNIKRQETRSSSSAHAPDVPVGSSQVFTKPAFETKSVARTDFGTPTKQNAAPVEKSAAEIPVSLRERNRAIKLAIALTGGFIAALGIIVLIFILSA